ncbi:MAG TPA: hypothetical protein VIK35_13265 [Verrucomicrobiae bacterium]
MNNPITSEFTAALVFELRSYLNLCEEILALAMRENQALCGQTNYQSFEFQQKRKSLLPNLESLSTKLRNRRIVWQQASPSEREHCQEIKPLFQNIQSLVMKVLLLDRENQQAMLRRGLVPARHLPAAAVQQPHYVANLYRRNSIV